MKCYYPLVRWPHVHYRGGRSGYKGVIFCPNLRIKPWKAYIRQHGMYITIGYFPTKEDAARAFNESSRKLFGKDAYVNDIR